MTVDLALQSIGAKLRKEASDIVEARLPLRMRKLLQQLAARNGSRKKGRRKVADRSLRSGRRIQQPVS